MYVCVYIYIYAQSLSHVLLFVAPQTIACQGWTIACPWHFRQDCCHFLLQGMFLTQESNSHLLQLLDQQVNSLLPAPRGKPHINVCVCVYTHTHTHTHTLCLSISISIYICIYPNIIFLLPLNSLSLT